VLVAPLALVNDPHPVERRSQFNGYSTPHASCPQAGRRPRGKNGPQAIAPCTLIPAGSPGLLLLNDANYFVEWNVGTGDAVLGFRLTHCVSGQVYDLEGYDCHNCTCGDYVFRRQYKDPRGCKHMIAMKQVRGIS
jgi:hypothetical protein